MYIYYLLRVRVSLSVCVVLWLCCCGSVRHQWCVVSQLFWLAGIGAVCMRSRVYTEQCGSGAVGSSDPHRRGCSESRSLWKCFQEEERQKGFTSKWSLLHWTVYAEGLDHMFILSLLCCSSMCSYETFLVDFVVWSESCF